MQKIMTEVDGVFKNGTPGSVRGTKLNAEWFNAVQDEIVNFIEGAGDKLDATNSHQLLDALYAILQKTNGLSVSKIVISSQVMRTELSNGHLTFNGGGHVVDFAADGITIDGLNVVEANHSSGEDKYLEISGGIQILSKLIAGGNIECEGGGNFAGDVRTPKINTDAIDPETSGNMIQVGGPMRVNGSFNVGTSKNPSNTVLSGRLQVLDDCDFSGELEVTGNAELKSDVLVRGKFTEYGDCDLLGNTRVGDTNNHKNLDVFGYCWVRRLLQASGPVGLRGVVKQASNSSTLKSQAASFASDVDNALIIFKMEANIVYYVNGYSDDSIVNDHDVALPFLRESGNGDLLRMFPG